MEEKIINGRPVKIWTREIEETAMEQIENLTTLPFLYHHLAIMPDVHAGMGMPIGGVLACTDAVIPNAVGVDIGCGMCAVKTNWKVSEIPAEVLRKKIMKGIRERIPLDMNEEIERLNAKGIVHAIRCKDDMQEASGAYKDIEEVIANELDLVKIKTRLLPIAVIKG